MDIIELRNNINNKHNKLNKFHTNLSTASVAS